MIKIGISTNPKVREHQLDTTKYAGLNDWKIVETKFVEKAGKAETKIHRALSDYQVFHKYFRDGQFVQSSETFESKFDIAFKAFRESCEDDIVGRNGPTHETI